MVGPVHVIRFDVVFMLTLSRPIHLGAFPGVREGSPILLTGRDMLGFLKTGKALGIPVPQAKFACADVVIE